MSATPAVVASGLTRRFGSFVAVDRVSFQVAPGEIFGFLGSNGAGKTTTIRMLCGLLRPSHGSASVLGFDVARDARALRRRIGYMSQRFSLYADLTAEENLAFWGAAYGLSGARLARRLAWALEEAELGDRRRTLVRTLPAGFHQRLALVAALLHEPAVVFLDEPTAGVDPEMRRRCWALIDALAAAGTTVFVTTHHLDEAERCHRVALMHAGRLLALDTVAALKAMLAPGTVLEIHCQHPARALGVLERLEGVLDAALFGDSLHLVLDQPGRRDAVLERLRSAGFTSVRAATIDATLEEAVIHTIKRAEAETGQNAASPALPPTPAAAQPREASR